MAVPLTSVTSQAAYEFSGSVTSPALTLEKLTIRDLSAKVKYQNGKLTLTELVGTIDQPGEPRATPGRFAAPPACAQSPRPGRGRPHLRPHTARRGAWHDSGFHHQHDGNGVRKRERPHHIRQAGRSGAWTASAELASKELVAEGRHIKGVSLKVKAAKGVVSLTEAKAAVEGIDVTGEGTLALTGKYAFTATVRTSAADVTDLRKLVPELDLPAPVEGVLDTESHVTGTASPFHFAASGRVTASKLTLGKTLANRVALKWNLTPERVSISDLKADVFGGTVTGSADVPFAANKAGTFSVAFKGMDAAAASAFVPDFPVRIAGKVSGKVGGTITPPMPGQSRVGNLDVDLTAPQLSVQGVPGGTTGRESRDPRRSG